MAMGIVCSKGKKEKGKKAEMNSLIFDNEMKINWIIDIHLDDNQAVFALSSIGIMLIDIDEIKDDFTKRH